MTNKNLKIISWNVNGLRAVLKKGFLDWVKKDDPDIICLQETKLSHHSQLDYDVVNLSGYHSKFNCASNKKGYSGTVIFSKQKPLQFITEFDVDILNKEGRIVGAEYTNFVLFNVYFPNGKRDNERLQFKMDFYQAFLTMVNKWQKKKPVIFCGDVNTAHKEIDLARPKANSKSSGFLPIEREWIDQVLKNGYIDTLREFHPEEGLYTWWDMITRARERNVGWRIDYFFISQSLRPNLQDAFILSDVYGSDHCPIGIKLKIT